MEKNVSEECEPTPTMSNTKIRGSVRKAPVVRQTLASKMRLELGNKLLYYKNQLEKSTTTLNTTNINLNHKASNHYGSQKGTETKSAPCTARNLLNRTNNNSQDVKLISKNVPNATKTSTKNVPTRNYETTALNKTSDNKDVRFKNVPSTTKNVLNKTSDNKDVRFKNIQSPSKILSKNVPSTAKTVLNKTSDIKDVRFKNIQSPSKILSKNVPSTAKNVLNKTSDIKDVRFKSVQIPSKIPSKNIVNTTRNVLNKMSDIKSVPKMSTKTTKIDQSKSTSKIRFSRATLPVDKKFVMGAKLQPLPETKRSPFRKSLSAMHFKRVSNLNRNSTIHRAASWANVSSSEPTPKFMSPIHESKSSQIVFRTPSLAKRRSINFCTPLSPSLPSPYPTQTPSSHDLKERLSFWLHKQGKPIGAFHHLRCFDLTPVEEENKENIEIVDVKSESYEELRIPQETSVANDILFDLHKLIIEGYPRNQCEAWLQVIRAKFAEVEEHSQYWECRAALEEARGDLTKVLECYQKAIIKGAEIQEVDHSLESLFQKFQFLNISPKLQTKQEISKAKMTLDARNTFKSKVINFAIQERSRKKTDNAEMDKFQFVATPVRRSTRTSRSGYVSTPGVKLYKTLGELDSPTQKSLKFKTNKALHV